MYASVAPMCDVCGKGHETEDCPEMLDDKLAAAMETNHISRARLTLPSYLRVVDDSDGSIRVLAKEFIPRKTQFDAYEARKTTQDLTQAGVFALKVFLKEGAGSIHLDASSERECNWLCLVPTARTAEEKNCIVIQMRTSIYYMTSRDINVDEELRVWYSPFYAHKLGASTEPDGLTVTMLMYRPADVITTTVASLTTQEEISLQAEIDLIQVTSIPVGQEQDVAIESLFCAICGEPCASQQLLEAHELTHTMSNEATSGPFAHNLDSPDILERLVKVRPPAVTPGPDGMFKCPHGCQDIAFESEQELSRHIVEHVEMEIKKEEPAKKRGRPRKHPLIIMDDEGSEKATPKRRGRPPKSVKKVVAEKSDVSSDGESPVESDIICDPHEPAATCEDGVSARAEVTSGVRLDVLPSKAHDSENPVQLISPEADIESDAASTVESSKETPSSATVLDALSSQTTEHPQKSSVILEQTRRDTSKAIISPVTSPKKSKMSSNDEVEKSNANRNQHEAFIYESYTPTQRIPNLPTNTIIRTRRAAKREIQILGTTVEPASKRGKLKSKDTDAKTKKPVKSKDKDVIQSLAAKTPLSSKTQKRKAATSPEGGLVKLARSDFEDKVIRSLGHITDPISDECPNDTTVSRSNVLSPAKSSRIEQNGGKNKVNIYSSVPESDGGDDTQEATNDEGSDDCIIAISSEPVTIVPTSSSDSSPPESYEKQMPVSRRTGATKRKTVQPATAVTTAATSTASSDRPSTVIIVANGIPTLASGKADVSANQTKGSSSSSNTSLASSSGDGGQTFTCAVCDQSFTDYDTFEAHQVSHNRDTDLADTEVVDAQENMEIAEQNLERVPSHSSPAPLSECDGTAIDLQEDVVEHVDQTESVPPAADANAAEEQDVHVASGVDRQSCESEEVDSIPHTLSFDVEIEEGGAYEEAVPRSEISLLPENETSVEISVASSFPGAQTVADNQTVGIINSDVSTEAIANEVALVQDELAHGISQNTGGSLPLKSLLNEDFAAAIEQARDEEMNSSEHSTEACGKKDTIDESTKGSLPTQGQQTTVSIITVKKEVDSEKSYKKSEHIQAVNSNCDLTVREDGKYNYTCKHCQVVSVAFEDFELHLEKSHPDSFKCVNCCENYSRYEHLQHHECTVKVSDLYVCKVCGRAHESAQALKKHMQGHERQFQCQKCMKKLVRSENLKKHVCVDPSQEPQSVSCSMCGAEFSTKKYLLRHMNSHTGQFSCEHCGKSYGRKESMLQHMRLCYPESMANYFPCGLCSKVFAKEVSLMNHMKVHEERFKCEVCFQVFTSKFNLDKHDPCPETAVPFEQTATGVKCMDCGKEYPSLKNLRRHQSIHTDKNKCHICGKTFSRKEECEAHMLICEAKKGIEADGSLKCRACDEVFTDPTLFHRHMTAHNSVYRCNNCTKSFLRQHNYQQHLKEGNCKKWDGKSTLPCDECGKHFATPNLLDRHMIIHGEPRFECKACNRKFVRSDHFNEHICLKGDNQRVSYNYLKYQKKKDPVICDVCGKIFVSSSNLNKHKLTHGEKNEECPICGKRFHIKTGLKEHLKYVHTDENNVECPHCGVRMKCRNSLFGHIKQFHSGENTQFFQCDQCDKEFRQKGNLIKHLLTHSDEKTYLCKVTGCMRKFKFSEQLKKHMNWHEHGARFSCEQCDKRFIMKHELDKHNRQNHMGIVYQCRLCNCDFKHQSTLKRHLERRHADAPDWKENTNEFVRLCEQQRPQTIATSEGGEQFVIYGENQSYFIVENGAVEGEVGQYLTTSDAQEQMQYIILPGDNITPGELQYDAAGNLVEVDVKLPDNSAGIFGAFEQSQQPGATVFIRNPDGSLEPVHLDTSDGQATIEVGGAVDSSIVDMGLTTQDLEGQLIGQPQVAKMALAITIDGQQQTVHHIPDTQIPVAVPHITDSLPVDVNVIADPAAPSTDVQIEELDVVTTYTE